MLIHINVLHGPFPQLSRKVCCAQDTETQQTFFFFFLFLFSFFFVVDIRKKKGSHSQGVGSHFDFCPRPCPSTCRWVRLATRRHIGPHFVKIPCSRAHLGRATAACVSSPKRRSIGSHMQQDMGFSKARPQLDAPIRLFEYRSLQKTTIQKNGDNSS